MSHSLMNNWLANIKSDDIDGGLADDFDGSLSGLGVELGANTYNMSEALLALPPVFKQENGSRIRVGSSKTDAAKQASSSSGSVSGQLQDQSMFSSISSPSLTLALGKGSPLSFHGDLITSSVHSLSLPSLQQHSDSSVDHMNPEWVNLMTSMKLQEVDDGGDNRDLLTHCHHTQGINTTTTTCFQYLLCAATSPATRLTEETLTYLNQGQSYEIKLKRRKEGSDMEEQTLKSIVRVVFHERRLQYMEKEQLEIWKLTRPGERIVDIDIPLSHGLLDVKIEPHRLNCVEFVWDPSFDTSVFIKVHCISTEFTAKKHGGEKGVPFRIQVETYTQTPGEIPILLHCASCQVKVFKPKGADRKNKTDREKIERRSAAEKSKYQPSYECTVLTEIPLEQVHNYLELLYRQQDEDEGRNIEAAVPESSVSQNVLPNPALSEPIIENLPSQTQIGLTPDGGEVISNAADTNCSSLSKPTSVGLSTSIVPCTIASQTGSNSSRKRPSETCLSMCMSASSPIQPTPETEESLLPSASPDEVALWLQTHRFANFVSIFQNFSGSDLLRLYRDDLIQICGIADGIRLYNTLKARSVRPMLTIYVCQASTVIGQHKAGVSESSPVSSRSSTPSPTPPSCSSKYEHVAPTMPLLVNPVTTPNIVWANSTCTVASTRSESKDSTSAQTFLAQKRQMPEMDSDSGSGPLTMFKKQRMQNLELTSREVYQALYIDTLSERRLSEKIAALYAILPGQILEILVYVPTGIYVLVTDLVVQNMKDNSRYFIEAVEGEDQPGNYRVTLKCVDNF